MDPLENLIIQHQVKIKLCLVALNTWTWPFCAGNQPLTLATLLDVLF